jgi:hypothetical protein
MHGRAQPYAIYTDPLKVVTRLADLNGGDLIAQVCGGEARTARLNRATRRYSRMHHACVVHLHACVVCSAAGDAAQPALPVVGPRLHRQTQDHRVTMPPPRTLGWPLRAVNAMSTGLHRRIAGWTCTWGRIRGKAAAVSLPPSHRAEHTDRLSQLPLTAPRLRLVRHSRPLRRPLPSPPYTIRPPVHAYVSLTRLRMPARAAGCWTSRRRTRTL